MLGSETAPPARPGGCSFRCWIGSDQGPGLWLPVKEPPVAAFQQVFALRLGPTAARRATRQLRVLAPDRHGPVPRSTGPSPARRHHRRYWRGKHPWVRAAAQAAPVYGDAYIIQLPQARCALPKPAIARHRHRHQSYIQRARVCAISAPGLNALRASGLAHQCPASSSDKIK
jgi:hypothetical protein